MKVMTVKNIGLIIQWWVFWLLAELKYYQILIIACLNTGDFEAEEMTRFLGCLDRIYGSSQ